MSKCWIVVAHRAGARIFLDHGRSAPPELLHTLEHPAGRLQARELGSDRPGRTTASAGPGRHALADETSVREQGAQVFARELATRLAAARNAHECDAIVLVAEPHMLGLLRGALDAHTAALVRASLARDLVHVADRDIGEHLRELE